MAANLREAIAKEFLSVLTTKGTPDIIAIDCALKRRNSSLETWPFESADDAAACFKKIIAQEQGKYAQVFVFTDKDTLLLTIEDTQGQMRLL